MRVNYFWKNNLVELKMLDDNIKVFLEKSLYDFETRKLLEKGKNCGFLS